MRAHFIHHHVRNEIWGQPYRYGFEFAPYFILLAQMAVTQLVLGLTKESGSKMETKITRFGAVYLCYDVLMGMASVWGVYLRFLGGNAKNQYGPGSTSIWGSYQVPQKKLGSVVEAEVNTINTINVCPTV